MSDVTFSEVAKNGLWTNNPALVQLLGLCPLLAVTGTVVNALGLGLATLLVLIGSNMIVSLIRHQVSDAIRLPTFVIIIVFFKSHGQKFSYFTMWFDIFFNFRNCRDKM